MKGGRPTAAQRGAAQIDRTLQGFAPARWHQLARFGLAGASSTILYFVLVSAIVVSNGMPPVPASVTAYLVSLVVSYALQSRFAFRVSGHSALQVVRFLATAGVGLAVSYGVMVIANNRLGLPAVYGAMAVSIVIPAVNYIVLSRWVFADRGDADGKRE